MIKRILVGLSGDTFTPSAVKHAIDLARRHKAEITGIAVTDLARLASVGPVPLGGGAAAVELSEHRIEEAERRVAEVIKRFENDCLNEKITACVDREADDPIDALTRQWRYHDLVVVGLRGLFEYGLVRNPDDMLLRIIRAGIRPIVAVGKEYGAVKKALIAYNGSLEAAKAMKSFVQMSPWQAPALHIVCFEKSREDPQRLLADAANYCSAHGYNVETEFIDDDPRERLIDHAQKIGVDIIVMGSTGRSRVAEYVLGDTVLTAIKESPIPLYLMR
jgi:nucleotide-binding universal stress UspA family protein